MTITCTSLFRTLALGAIILSPIAAAAQGPRATTPAPAPAPRTASAPAPAPAARSTTALSSPGWTEQEYRLGSGDKLRIEVYGQSQLSQSLQIRPDGKITLPLVGDVGATGRTSNELRDSIATSLKEYVNNPVVTVIVMEATSAQIHVMGEVSSPGTQVLTGPTTVLQALAQAGGFKEFAKRGDIRILRKTSTGVRTIDYDYKQAVKGRTEPVFLQPGDTVVVP
jgi:polysaccharide export outer membrane protein